MRRIMKILGIVTIVALLLGGGAVAKARISSEDIGISVSGYASLVTCGRAHGAVASGFFRTLLQSFDCTSQIAIVTALETFLVPAIPVPIKQDIAPASQTALQFQHFSTTPRFSAHGYTL